MAKQTYKSFLYESLYTRRQGNEGISGRDAAWVRCIRQQLSSLTKKKKEFPYKCVQWKMYTATTTHAQLAQSARPLKSGTGRKLGWMSGKTNHVTSLTKFCTQSVQSCGRSIRKFNFAQSIKHHTNTLNSITLITKKTCDEDF